MKKLLLAILLFTITLKVNAQNTNNDRNPMYSGMKFGANYTQFSFENDDISKYHDRKLGGYAGVYFNFYIAHALELQPEILFTVRGSTLLIDDFEFQPSPTESAIPGIYKSNIDEYSVTLPLPLRCYISQYLFIEAGPEATYIISRIENVKEDNLGISDGDTPSSWESDYDKLDIGVIGGIGYKPNRKLGFVFRYSYGLLERDEAFTSSILNFGIELRL